MIRFLTIIITAMLVLPTFSQDSLNLIKFWQNAQASSPEYIKYQKNKSNLKNQSLARFLPIKKTADRFFSSLTNHDTTLTNYLSRQIFSTPTFRSIIFFDDEYEPNAGIDPNGNLEVGITLWQILDSDEFVAVMSHEAAHLALKHGEIGYFNYMKEERNAKIAGTIAATLYTAAVAYGEYTYTKVTGDYRPYAVNNSIPNAIAISESFKSGIEFQQMLYSREQEYEADFFAALYLDYVGIGREKLMSALNKLRMYYADLGYNTKTMNKDSTHPSFEDRIKAIERKKELVNTKYKPDTVEDLYR